MKTLRVKNFIIEALKEENFERQKKLKILKIN